MSGRKIVKTVEKWEDLDSVEVIYKTIRIWEYEAGEDFIDQNESIVNEIPFANYLLGKGLISKEMLNNLLKEKGSLQEMLDGYNTSFCVFPYGNHMEECWCKKYHLLADYIFQVDVLRKRLFCTLKGWGYDESDKEENEAEYGITEITLDEGDYEGTGEKDRYGSFNTVHDEWIFVSSHSITEVNEIVAEARKIDRRETK